MDKIGNSIVATSKVDLHNEHTYRSTVEQLLDQLGGIGKFVKPGMKVLLKPDLVSHPDDPKCLPTSTELIMAVAKLVKSRQASVVIADSPFVDNGDIHEVWRHCGLIEKAREHNIGLVNLEKYGSRPVTFKTDAYYLSRLVFDADLIINLPKLRLDPISLYAGAISNMLGLLPGNHKSKILQYANSSKTVAQKMCDLIAAVNPALTIMDAVNLMNENGQISGEKLLLASEDYVAIDVIAGHLFGIDADKNSLTRAASDSGLGMGYLDSIIIRGVLDAGQFSYSKNYSFISKLSNSFRNILNSVNYSYLKLLPQIDEAKCDNCQLCSKVCPTKALTVEKNTYKLMIKDSMCINCWCCRENCPNNAIVTKSVTNLPQNGTIYRKNCVV